MISKVSKIQQLKSSLPGSSIALQIAKVCGSMRTTVAGPKLLQCKPYAGGDTTMTQSALVLFSGGQDSTVCLAWALERFDLVETIGFNYGQRHSIELTCRTAVLRAFHDRFPRWSKRFGSDHVLDLAVLGGISETALTKDRAIAFASSGLPN